MSTDEFFERVLTVRLTPDRRGVDIIDQTLLPGTEKRIVLSDREELWDAIRKLKVRGAPAIGVFAAYALAVTSAAYETDVNRQAIITFLNETTEAQRKFFIDRLFTVFEEEKITTVSQLSAFGLALIPRAFKMFSEMDEEAKKIAALLVKTYSGRLSSDAYRSLSDNLNSFIEKRRWHRDNETSE